MDEIGLQTIIVMPPPFSADHTLSYDYTVFAEVLELYPERFGFLAGGGTLNPLLQEAVRAGEVTEDMRREFEEQAEEIVRSSAAGFGEFVAEHLSFDSTHPYIYAPPDHELFLLLADIAAREGMPIDLHMEAVAGDMPLPERFASSPNPEILSENIEALERLLTHNREARIVWVHAGWDNTGHRTTELMRQLLERNSNLYLNIKISTRDSIADNMPLAHRLIKPEWLELISDFPDRFTIGSDEFFRVPEASPIGSPSAAITWSLVNQLPDDLAYQVACENPLAIYRMD